MNDLLELPFSATHALIAASYSAPLIVTFAHTAPSSYLRISYRSVFRPGLFADQHIVVTGGGSGIGRATALMMARDGAKVILYGEGHVLPAGTRENDEGFREMVPEDSGWVIGAQLGG